MKTLLLDIETAPNKVYAWGLFKQNIALNQIEEPGYTLCWAAKWLGKKEIMFRSVHTHGRKAMLAKIHALLAEADVVIHYNGSSFDIPTLNREFLTDGHLPPAPVQEVDLLKTVRARFRFLSNKLDYIATQLLGQGKVAHKGMELWRKCMVGDEAAWRVMERYNKRDVVILEKVYKHLLPWIQPHPNHNLYQDKAKAVCPNCGSSKLHSRGFAYTATMVYRRLQCTVCGKWSRVRTNCLPKEKKQSVVLGVK